MTIEQRLHDLGIVLPDLPPSPQGNYIPGTITGNLLFTAGQIPTHEGKVAYTGIVGADLSLEDGQEAARLCCLNGLAVARNLLGDLERVKRVVKVNGFVRSAAGFTDQPKVINGASDLLVAILGDAGRHARAALGVNELPLGVGVEIDFLFEVDA
jgi:enamine deaminase RidA (YjgF/YER057c/UK114 family)